MRFLLLMRCNLDTSSPELASTFQLVHTISMRTTITLDPDVYEVATLYAKGRGVTLGTALSELARKGAEARRADKSTSPNLVRGPKGMLMFPPRSDGRVITNEMVKAALEEYDD